MKNALSPEEWENGNQVPVGKDGRMCGNYIWDNRKHATAARCLLGQDFGFTREDVKLIRYACGIFNRKMKRSLDLDMPNQADVDKQTIESYRLLADKLEALLPPEEEG